MSKKLLLNESFKRFSVLQKIITLFFIFTLIFALIILVMTQDFKLFALVTVISITVTLIIFNLTKSNHPFIITKTALEQYRLMGEVNFFRVEKKYFSDSPFSPRFRYKNLIMIREYRQDGTLFMETPYKNGKIWGEVKTYSIHGKLRKSATYYQGEIDGKNIEMEGNDVTREKSYKGAHLHGVSKTYDKDTGNLISEENFKYGVHHGPSIFYNSKTGQKTHEENYKDGKKYGKFSYYDEAGKLLREVNYHDDKIDGKYCEYYSGGGLKLEQEFQFDKKEGVAREYYEDGTLKSENRYRDDKKHGPQLAYYKSGEIMSKQFYDFGEKKGDAIFYDPDGNPVE